MIDVGLARRYVQPLFDVAQEKDIVEVIAAELEELSTSLAGDSSLRVILIDPSVSRQDRIAIVEKIFSDFNSYSVNFIRLLIEKNRSNILDKAHSIFMEIKDDADGILSGVVESAMPLDAETGSELKVQLEQNFGHRLKLEFKTTPEILGGLRIRVGNSVMDGSITGKLDNLKKAMIG